jgi:hypothetical protein
MYMLADRPFAGIFQVFIARGLFCASLCLLLGVSSLSCMKDVDSFKWFYNCRVLDCYKSAQPGELGFCSVKILVYGLPLPYSYQITEN